MKARDYARVLAGAARVEANRRLGRATLPYKLELIVTFACQSRCRTCNIWQRYLDEPAKRAEELSAEQFVRAVRSARSTVRWVSLTGGEVTDRPDFPELFKGIVAAVGDRLALLQVTTNGIDPDRTAAVFPELVRAARGIPLYITLSLDGIGKTYQRVRGVADGYAKVKRSMAVLKALEREEPHLTTGFQVTLSELNVDEADALFEDASVGQERPIVTIATNALVLTRGKVDVDVRKASPKVQAAAERMWQAYPRRSLKDLPPTLHLGLARRFFETGQAPLPCSAGHATLTIDPYGGVLQCDSRATPLARLADHDFDLDAMCRSAPFREALAPVSGCRECWTPCHAYPTLMHHPVGTAVQYGRAMLGAARRRTPKG
jgi:MoaA/NifB/PqqE/SkfB family radical SAM enzyme